MWNSAVPLILAQDTPETPWWHILVEQAFGLTILLIFLVALISVLVNQWRKDKCLKLLHRYHASYTDKSGRAAWGDLIVYSKGLELLYDAPYKNARGMVKTSSLIYPSQLTEAVALARIADGLERRQMKRRLKQIRRSFKPGPFRKTRRGFQNLTNTFRDAFSKALTAFIGQITQHVQNDSLEDQQSNLQSIGDDLLGAAANRYEPILERHIGQPVVVELACPANEAAALPARQIDIPGYLVDYSDKFLAVFNVEHETIDTLEICVKDRVEQANLVASWEAGRFTLTCTGPDLLILRSLKTNEQYAEPQAVLIPGTTVNLGVPGQTPPTVVITRTQRVDLVCSREHAVIRFGGNYVASDKRQTHSREHGIAPDEDVSV